MAFVAPGLWISPAAGPQQRKGTGMTDGAVIWDRLAKRYARSPVADIPAYERTLERTRAHLTVNDNVLELGCGTGSTALRLADAVRRLTATDYSANMIAIANAKLQDSEHYNVRFVRQDMFAEPLLRESHDVVLAFNLLHLVNDVGEALQHVSTLLKPGALFISKTPCLAEGSRLLRAAVSVLGAIGIAPKVGFLGAAELEAAFADAGFTVIERGDYPASPPSRFIVARKG